MAANGKKISEQTAVTSLTGNELFPFALNGANGAVKASKIKDFVKPDLKQVFVDLWTQCYDCQYDATKGDKPFTCNGLDLSYSDAVKIYNAPRLTYNNIAGFTNLLGQIRTIIIGSDGSGGTLPSFVNAFRTSSLEVIRVSSDTSTAYVDTIAYAFYQCVLLKRILGVIAFNYGKGDANNAFTGCVKLTDVSIRGLKQNVAFSDSLLLSLSSLKFLVTNAINTNNITVTVHADVYAKLTGDTTNAAAAALTASELAKWQQVATDAAAKNISFACK